MPQRVKKISFDSPFTVFNRLDFQRLCSKSYKIVPVKIFRVVDEANAAVIVGVIAPHCRIRRRVTEAYNITVGVHNFLELFSISARKNKSQPKHVLLEAVIGIGRAAIKFQGKQA